MWLLRVLLLAAFAGALYVAVWWALPGPDTPRLFDLGFAYGRAYLLGRVVERLYGGAA